MKGPTIKVVGRIAVDENGKAHITWSSDHQHFANILEPISVSHESLETQLREPILLLGNPARWTAEWWLFRYKILMVDLEVYPHEELLVHIKHLVLKAEGKLEHMKREIQAFENMERLPAGRRERIPGSVRLFVWQRDGGACVKCGSRERMEFDHIIPIAEGGSSTERNVQLLCEQCNREKGKNLC